MGEADAVSATKSPTSGTNPSRPRAAGLVAAMAALRRPLEFAARDEGRHLHKVSRLEATIAGACDAVLAPRLPSDFRRAIEGLRGAFAEPLELDERIARVRVARQWLAPFEAPAFGLKSPVTELKPKPIMPVT